jgi:uncharacterized protein DUF6065
VKLICYPTSGERPNIIPAPLERDWMDVTEDGFAYRCLPLNIANAHGWFILNTVAFVAQWDGGNLLDSVSIKPVERESGNLIAISHFGYGVLTFHINGLFRTEPGFDLFVTGPFNMFKDGIQPLTGVVETDWSPFTFTMNWRFTRKLTPVAFDRDEPICMIYPVARGMIESVEPEFRSLEEDPKTRQSYLDWSARRLAFNEDLAQESSEAHREKWQKEYFRGYSTQSGAAPEHRTKIRAKPFK